jgi:hypothetical protein
MGSIKMISEEDAAGKTKEIYVDIKEKVRDLNAVGIIKDMF